jgi:hypothetical protein
MFGRRSFFLILQILAFAAPLVARQAAPILSQPVQRDPQALVILKQVLKASGGDGALGAIHDLIGSGTITYFWAGEEVQGSVTVKGRGTGQFRVDALLPEGVRTWIANNGSGSLREANGRMSPIAPHYAVNLGSFTFPALHLLAALQDNSKSISYLGLITYHERQTYVIRVQQVVGPDIDPSGTLSRLTTKDFYIDENTLQIVSTRDQVHSKDSPGYGHPHDILFSDYRSVNGLLVPFSVTDTIEGNRTFAIQLEQINFNANLTDTDFER